jgi:hypothetical protein
MSEAEQQHGALIRIAGNTGIPCLMAIQAKGFRVWLDYLNRPHPADPRDEYQPNYQAEGHGAYFSATSTEELLGLIAMWEVRGDSWQPRSSEWGSWDTLLDAARTYDHEGNLLPDE